MPLLRSPPTLLDDTPHPSGQVSSVTDMFYRHPLVKASHTKDIHLSGPLPQNNPPFKTIVINQCVKKDYTMTVQVL